MDQAWVHTHCSWWGPTLSITTCSWPATMYSHPEISVCASARCFKCNLWINHRTSFGEATCLSSMWIFRGQTVYLLQQILAYLTFRITNGFSFSWQHRVWSRDPSYKQSLRITNEFMYSWSVCCKDFNPYKNDWKHTASSHFGFADKSIASPEDYLFLRHNLILIASKHPKFI